MKPIFIDGSSMLVTAYYGNLPRELMFEKDPEKKKVLYSMIMHTSTGIYTNAIYTMIKQLIKIFKSQNPTHIVFAFDKTRNTFRKQLYSEYKGNRGQTAEPLKQQFIEMENILLELGFPVLVSDTYEADDLIGSAISHFRKTIGDDTIYVITKDHDYLQLIDDNTRLWLIQNKQEVADTLNKKYFGDTRNDLPDKVFEVTVDNCQAEFGVTPNLIADFKGIVGDTSDNIPGVKGVGDKTAIPLLLEYGSLEEIYANVQACTSDAEKKDLSKFWKESFGISRSPIKAFEEHKDTAILSKSLATIKTDIPLDLTEEQMKFTYDQDKWDNIFKRYEFKSLVGTTLSDSKPKRRNLFGLSL